jgi:hypothetical protein
LATQQSVRRSFAGRLAALFGTRKRRIGAALFLIIAFVVVYVVGFSGAVLSSSSQTPANAIGAADFGFTLSDTGQLITGTNWAPGTSHSGSVEVRNGSTAGKFTVAATGVTNPLGPVLDLVIEETAPGSRTIYSGKLNAVGSRSLGTFNASERRTYRLTVSWPSSATDPGLQGASVNFNFDWNATST